MYTVKHGGDIHRGDLVAISNGNYFCIGIYYGQGQGGTVQYFSPINVVNSRQWWEKSQKDGAYADNNKPWKLTRIWKHYINTPSDTRILKLNRDNITDKQEIENILEAKEILKEFNIEVNY
jgi:hypothetical protein